MSHTPPMAPPPQRNDTERNDRIADEDTTRGRHAVARSKSLVMAHTTDRNTRPTVEGQPGQHVEGRQDEVDDREVGEQVDQGERQPTQRAPMRLRARRRERDW